MSDPAARLLRLLALLQGRRFWNGAELAECLEVTQRTVRRDVDRLRSLGYPVDASVGSAGGYQLGSGATLPPLLLDDDEALAVTLGLRSAAAGSIAGIEEATVRALAKLEQVLPARLRKKVQTLNAAVTSLQFTGPVVNAQVLVALAAAHRAHETVTFGYADAQGIQSRRHVEPHGLVHTGTRWYLVAWDQNRDDWRTFRLDRISEPVETREAFTPRAIPWGSAKAYIARSVSAEADPLQARVVFHAPRDVIAAQVPARVATLEALDAGRCLLKTAARRPRSLALHLAAVGVDFEVLGPPELSEAVQQLGRELTAAGERSVRVASRTCK